MSAGEPTTDREIEAWNEAHRKHPGTDGRRIHYCRHPACFEEATWVVVAVTPQHVGDDADPTDAITSLSQVCDAHNKDPWIEVKRLGGGGR